MNESELSQKLSDLLLIYRNKNKITLQQLSQDVSLDAKFLNKLEKGQHATLMHNYLKIAKSVGVPIYEIDKIIKEYFVS